MVEKADNYRRRMIYTKLVVEDNMTRLGLKVLFEDVIRQDEDTSESLDRRKHEDDDNISDLKPLSKTVPKR